MKLERIAAVALVLLGTGLCAEARDHADRKIVIACPPTRAPMMADVVTAIEFSDYDASPSVRREILARAREACAARPDAVLSFAPPERAQSGDSQLASK